MIVKLQTSRRFVPSSNSFGLCHPPDAVEDGAVREDADVEVGLQDCVEGTNLLVPEESVRHPDFTRICHRQIPNTI